jgi:uncharacterized membrane protein
MHMENLNRPAVPPRSWLDTVIKVITILKLLVETAVWGLMLGLTIWFIYNNPLPKLMDSFTTSITQSLGNQENQTLQNEIKNINIPGLTH